MLSHSGDLSCDVIIGVKIIKQEMYDENELFIVTTISLIHRIPLIQNKLKGGHRYQKIIYPIMKVFIFQ